MSTPLTATAKLTFSYSVSGFIHKLNAYMAYNDILGQHQMVDRDGLTTVLWVTGAQYLWDIMRGLFSAASVPAPASVSLFSRSGILWNLIDVATLTGVGNGIGAMVPAQQITWVLRDTGFKKMRYLYLETTLGYVYHSPTGVGQTAEEQNSCDMLTGVDASAAAPFRWLKSRGDRFLAASGQIAGLTHDLNDKLKRARGFE